MEREVHDFYPTPPAVTAALLERERFHGPIWEPACGDGAVSQVLRSHGYSTIDSDLIARGYGQRANFLDVPVLLAPNIVTNPPYKLAEQFVWHAINLGAEKTAMLLRLTWLAGSRRYHSLFSKCAPSRVLVLAKRPTLWHGGDPDARSTGGKADYAWFVWDRAASGHPPSLHWLPPQGARE